MLIDGDGDRENNDIVDCCIDGVCRGDRVCDGDGVGDIGKSRKVLMKMKSDELKRMCVERKMRVSEVKRKLADHLLGLDDQPIRRFVMNLGMGYPLYHQTQVILRYSREITRRAKATRKMMAEWQRISTKMWWIH